MGRGSKHKCTSCGKPFYDLGKKPATCPSCGQQVSQKKKRPITRQKSRARQIKSEESSNPEVILGCMKNEIYRDDEKGFLIFTASIFGEEEEVRFRGAKTELPSKTYFLASGEWVDDPKYGRQFAYEYIGAMPNPPIHGVQHFLSQSQFEGIGSVLSERIVTQFGDRITDILSSDPSQLTTIEGINPDKAKTISDQWRKSAAEKSFDIFLADLGLKQHVRSAIADLPAKDIIKIIFETPYSLIEQIRGVGFRIADEIALKLGVERESVDRMIAGLEFALIDATKRDGHCGLPLDKIVEKSSELLGNDENTIRAVVLEGLASDFLVLETCEEEQFCFLKKLHFNEAEILQRIKEFRKPTPKNDSTSKAFAKLDDQFDFLLSEEQKKAIRSSCESNFSVISGGPGVGKTTIIRGLIKTLEKADVKFALCAPTGRAAKRLEQSSGNEATTIHRLLEFSPNGAFKRTAEHPLSQKAIICDEASMIDVELMHALFHALDAETKIILVGDVDQLPPVGPGQPFRDIINSGTVTVSYLQHNFRQSAESGIALAAMKVNSGQIPEAAQNQDLDDFHMISRTGSGKILEGVKEFCERLPNLKHGKYDPFSDVQILTPMNKGELGTSNLNKVVQTILNPGGGGGVKLFEHTLNRGDKVIQIKNNYEKNVFNGDIGKIIECDPKDGSAEVNFDGHKVEYTKSQLASNISLAYAITIHKSQGSEYPVLLLIVANEHQFMLARNLVYTGITRGRELVYVIGERNALSSASRKNFNTKRWTLLSQRLKKEHI